MSPYRSQDGSWWHTNSWHALTSLLASFEGARSTFCILVLWSRVPDQFGLLHTIQVWLLDIGTVRIAAQGQSELEHATSQMQSRFLIHMTQMADVP